MNSPNNRNFTTGRRSITPESPMITSEDPRWESAEFEEQIIVMDLEFIVPSHWIQASGPTVPRPKISYEGRFMWRNVAEVV